MPAGAGAGRRRHLAPFPRPPSCYPLPPSVTSPPLARLSLSLRVFTHFSIAALYVVAAGPAAASLPFLSNRDPAPTMRPDKFLIFLNSQKSDDEREQHAPAVRCRAASSSAGGRGRQRPRACSPRGRRVSLVRAAPTRTPGPAAVCRPGRRWGRTDRDARARPSFCGARRRCP
jgi:hypothetical protein